MSDVISQTVNIEIRERLADGTYKLKNPKTTADMVVDTASKVLMLPSERTKLNGIYIGAQVNAVTSVAGRIGAVTLVATDIAEETNRRFMIDAERTKLNGVATGANNYNHPSTHPYSIISNPPTIPTLTSQLTNNSGFLTSNSAVTGSYTGDGSASRTISIGFTPIGVYVNRASIPFYLGGSGGLATTGRNVIDGNSIIAVGIVSGGFRIADVYNGSTLDARTNMNGIIYTYVAFR